MNLYFRLHCTTVYDVEPHVKPICPRCGKLLGLRQEERDKVATIAEVSRLHPEPKPEPRWRIG